MIWISRIVKRMLAVSIAFLVFGIMDNGIMIIAGDLIDGYIGVALGVSALFSAGLGNAISDAVGMISGRTIESWLNQKLPLKHSAKQLKTYQIVFAETIGIIIGCLIGLAPLMFL